MLKKLALALVVVIAGILGYAATKPDVFHVARSTSINAPPEKIHPLIADFKAWRAWSPYEDKDPGVKRSYEGAQNGKGAVYGWDGNSDVGAGRMEIVDAPAPEKVVIKLDFTRPLEGHNVATFSLAPKGQSTDVTWAMDGPSPFVAKLASVFFDLDKMIGKDFEVGLAKLKAETEK